MEDYTSQIKLFLPLYLQSQDNEEYLEFLFESLQKNFDAAHYQFSLMSFHLIYMSFIYKTIWLMKISNQSEVIELFTSNKDLNDSINMYDISIVSEKKVIKLLKSLGCHLNEIKDFCSLIDRRDNCAHASGIIHYKEIHIKRYVEEGIGYLENIQHKTKPKLENIMHIFLEENWDTETRKSTTARDSFDQFLRENLISLKDLEYLAAITPVFIAMEATKKYIYQQVLYSIVLYEAYRLGATDENLFIKNLPILMKAINKQTEINIGSIIINEFFYIVPELTEKDMIMLRNITKFDIQEIK